mmetsp:Transcript_29900/g.87306  ORF Transcript_29900/g.87306 Transcript_29900/m.87306 type:complete len:586 (-) Transcript_29900:355-2112(-)
MTAMTRPAGAPAGADSAKYDLNSNPIYQIDMTTASTGKVVAQTKRRVRWRFGFSSREALAGGGTGTDCRGEEHEVTLIWSLTSGKRLVLMDGKEVHFSMGKPTSGKFQTSWTMRGNHVLKIVAYAAPPVRNRPDFKQFELFLDGMSFFSFPRIYELGIKAGGSHARGMVQHEGGARSASGTGGRQPYNNYSLPVEEENAWARRTDTYETQRGMNSVPAEVTTAPTTAASSTDDLMGAPLTAPGQDLMDQPGALLDTSVPTMAPPQPQFDEFAPHAAPAPTYNDVAGSVLNLYGPTETQAQQPAVPALPPSTSAPAEQQQQYYAQPPVQQQYYQEPPAQQFYQDPSQAQFAAPPQPQQQYYQEPPAQQQQYYQEPPVQQDQQYATPAKVENPGAAILPADTSPNGVADLDDVSKALKSLVNFDDINEKPVDEKLSMYSNPFENKNHLRDDQKVHKKGAPKSRGLTAKAADHGMVGRSLAEVKHLHGDGVRKPPSQEVMKTHAFDPAAAQAGMLVVYGSSAPPQQQPQAYGNYSMPGQPAQQPHDYSQGPPPIGPSAGTGFGVGSMIPGGGYSAPQQQQQQQAYAMR